VTRAVLLTLIALFCVAAPAAQAKSKPLAGIGEQNPAIFSDTRWIDLDKPDIRYVIPWDQMRTKRGRASVDLYLNAAEYRHARVLVSFGHSNRRHRELKMPTSKQFVKYFKVFRKRYPFVKTFQAWNEANNGFQPTFRKPKQAARIFNLINRSCRKCTITAPSVLDDGMKTIRWIQTFKKATKFRVKIWALHNHIDANRNRLGRHSTTALFLRHTRGQVWFTETGGIWNRWVPRGKHKKVKVKQYTHKTAVRAIRNIFKLARLNPRRVKRVYVYNWFAPGEKKPRWDSGLVDPRGKSRATLKTFKAQVRKYAR
jgi:hypothetical protein